jgi:hypothetical protein
MPFIDLTAPRSLELRLDGLGYQTEKTLEKIRRQIVQQDKRRRRMLQYFDWQLNA